MKISNNDGNVIVGCLCDHLIEVIFRIEQNCLHLQQTWLRLQNTINSIRVLLSDLNKVRFHISDSTRFN